MTPNILNLSDDDMHWQALGLCAQTDPELFHPEQGGSPAKAKAVCAKCDVREQCLQWALDHDERNGVWGGLSGRERRKLKNRGPGRPAGVPEWVPRTPTAPAAEHTTAA